MVTSPERTDFGQCGGPESLPGPGHLDRAMDRLTCFRKESLPAPNQIPFRRGIAYMRVSSPSRR